MRGTVPEGAEGPEVSVVIPAHGVAPWIGDAISSALDQDVRVQVIVVDDASQDESAAIARSFASGDDRVIVTVNDRTAGVCGARNTGLALAGAPWVLFLDGDDALIEGGVGALLAAVRPPSTGEHLVGSFGSFEHVDETGAPIESSWLADRADAFATCTERPLSISVLCRRTFNPPPGAQLLSTEALRAVGGWDEERSGSGQSEDFEVVMRLAARGSFAVVDEPVLRYLARASSRSNQGGNNRRRAVTRFAIVRRAPRRLRRRLGRAQASAYWRLVAPRLRRGLRQGSAPTVLHGLQDLLLACLFMAWGWLVWPLPAFQPRWPSTF